MTAAALLSKQDPAPYEWYNPSGASRVFIIGDHTGRRIPAALGNLGLSPSDLEKHIAWDIGTPDLARHLADALDAPAILATYSRLVVDCNRGADQPGFMPAVSDNIHIPGNAAATDADRRTRAREIYIPYRAEISARLARYAGEKITPLLLFVHSFTPEMNGVKRPWDIGLLWNSDEASASALLAALRRNNPGLLIGDNQPYSLKDAQLPGNSMETFAEKDNLPHLVIEFRQNLVDTPQKAAGMADVLLESLREVVGI